MIKIDNLNGFDLNQSALPYALSFSMRVPRLSSFLQYTFIDLMFFQYSSCNPFRLSKPTFWENIKSFALSNRVISGLLWSENIQNVCIVLKNKWAWCKCTVPVTWGNYSLIILQTTKLPWKAKLPEWVK